MSSPFSYLYFTFASNDSQTPHDVQIYSDISGGESDFLFPLFKLSLIRSSTSEWVSGDDSLEMTWSGGDTGSLTIVQASLVQEEPFQIVGETCQDGTVFYATQSVRQLSHTWLLNTHEL